MRRRAPGVRTLLLRALVALLLFAVLDVVFAVVDFEPDAPRLALLVLVCGAAVGLLLDSVDEGGPPWPAPGSRPVVPRGSDARLSSYVRLVEDHLTARTPDAGLRDRLVELSGGRLAEELAGPPRRLSRAEIDDYLRRIEEQ
ncbi:hypothetical protein [Nocardioides panaciterrulae]|uniref:Uncharacterized protein n=1 Tax=Nocardioides panaciterrulae TaxID=661492 RepID=A0A7Y9JA43_9ACTN|nr:hypothetical protein [Nocardioides panaciterrulae]NYD41003.1 hypothetical protein [Nocardioides panaciterrulae]